MSAAECRKRSGLRARGRARITDLSRGGLDLTTEGRQRRRGLRASDGAQGLGLARWSEEAARGEMRATECRECSGSRARWRARITDLSRGGLDLTTEGRQRRRGLRASDGAQGLGLARWSEEAARGEMRATECRECSGSRARWRAQITRTDEKAQAQGSSLRLGEMSRGGRI